jgi:hypothetical protein
MSEVTMLSDVANQVKTYWGALGINKLKQDALLPSLVSKDYIGVLENEGDTVRVSEINVPTATRKQTGSGESTFDSVKVSTSYVDIKANQTITAAFEIQNLVQLQSQIKQENSAIREALMQSLEVSLNEYLYSLVSPSASAPDHIINGVTDFNADQLAVARGLASKARWAKDNGWYLLLDSSYYSDFLKVTGLTSNDFVSDQAVVSGQIVQNRFGFKVLEDNSDAILTLGTSGADCALAFHKDFMHLVMPQSIEFKLSDLHSNKQHGYLLSASMVVGAALGCNGSKKHIKFYNT